MMPRLTFWLLSCYTAHNASGKAVESVSDNFYCPLQNAVNSVVDGLFCALVALGTVPIIKCPKVSKVVSFVYQLQIP